ncbi:MAG: hypothetical protein A2908_00795 [Candidatus Staskawiczbacteria bacterium RIFCSPLOWO2_01_FULL_38_12b]|uniref:Uncharacterized protein n=1 Tax=Candidatus Staskawiczbacteria bacterium RIFCSPLOWO2_01_FULL_38_12b TaxID=1802214 RepID=A0A1G2IGP2_9BACT|nr:MAG: hypothetical protein A2908_00795 [Candidatus Staskawiczbacteria bacterium RIFCSPLOWO2_01_FULL_38_12b]
MDLESIKKGIEENHRREMAGEDTSFDQALLCCGFGERCSVCKRVFRFSLGEIKKIDNMYYCLDHAPK